jgi:peptide deformylase
MIIEDKDKLRVVCESVESDEGLRIGELLIQELRKHSSGIGLAAPQIGINKRVFALRDKEEGFKIFLNPSVVRKQDPYLNKFEACLSFPGKFSDTIRYKQVSLSSYNGQVELNALPALVAQHECDHLDGVLMFDRAEPKKYDECFCGSREKYKFCCYGIIHGSK